MEFIEILNQLVFPTAGAAAGILAGLLMRSVALPRLSRLATRTASRMDDVVIGALRGPVLVWGMLLGVHFGISLAGYDPDIVRALRAPLLAVVILSVSWTVGRVAAAVVRLPQGAAASALPSARIVSSASQAAVIVIGALVALQTLGVSVAPILTALGVGGLAVGLALQDTLANLFAGFQILVSRQVRPGDFVKLSTGEEGFVEDITWRNTTVRQLANNIVIVPNAVLAQSLTTNFNLPHTEQGIVMQMGVSYDDDLPHVERVTIEVARTVQQDVEGAVRSFEPFIRYHTFSDSSINFSVILRGNTFTDNYLMRHEFVKRVYARYLAEGITIPYPQRTVHLHAANQPE